MRVDQLLGPYGPDHVDQDSHQEEDQSRPRGTQRQSENLVSPEHDEPDRDQGHHEDVAPIRGFRDRRLELCNEEGVVDPEEDHPEHDERHQKRLGGHVDSSGISPGGTRQLVLADQRAHTLLIDPTVTCIHPEAEKVS